MTAERTTTAKDPMDEVARLIREHDSFVIASHHDPDGDSLGSSMALALGLEQLGKRATVVIDQEVPRSLRGFPGMERVRVVERCPEGHDVAVIVESSGFERTGIRGLDRMVTVNIDHHAANPGYADVDWIDPEVSATGVMIHRLLRRLGVDVTPDIATHLYVTLLTDTGSFRFSNTDAETFRTAAELVERGADPAAVASAVYDGQPAARVRLLGRALTSLTLEAGGAIAWMVLPVAAFAEAGDERDTEGIINHAQAVEGVEVSVLFKELEADSFKVSLRSDGSVDVAAVAAEFGGGGHARAAGCALSGPFGEVRERVLEAVRRRRGGTDEASARGRDRRP